MPKQSHFQKLLRQIQVLKAPKHRLATFGASKIEYTLVTDVPGLPDRSKLRFGYVTAEKPMIITPENLKEKFIGFGDESREMADRMVSHYGEALRGLEYQFHNEPAAMRIELATPDELVKDLIKQYESDGSYRKALIRGSEKHWPLSIMKFIIEETMSSFVHNVQELNDRGFFDGEKRIEEKQRREIAHLFSAAQRDKQAVEFLGKKLKEYGLFEEYQDAFFRLIR
jgi:hypothetical protein